MLDRHWLLGVARREREALGRAIQYTDPSAWGNPSPWGGRTTGDVLAHLAAAELAAAALIGGEAATEVDEFRKSLGDRDFTIAGFNEWSLTRRAEEPIQTLALEWGRAADLLIARATRISDEDWHDREIDWLTETLRAGYLVQHRVCQWWLHGQDIRSGSGQPLRREHDPTYTVNDFAIKLIPYALALEGHSYPGLSVKVELEEVGGGTWHQSLEAGVTPEPDARPDVVIEGRGSWFALLATGRADADTVMYEGLINTGGLAAPGEAILRSLRAFP